LACFERQDTPGRDGHLFSGLRIPAKTSVLFFDLENSETRDFEFALLLQNIFHHSKTSSAMSCPSFLVVLMDLAILSAMSALVIRWPLL
jgi:hypothetical protein